VKFLRTELPGVIVVEPDVHGDERGWFVETHHQGRYAEAGIDAVFVQDNLSCSRRGTLRGLHAQLARPQGKLVPVAQGEVFDVALDIRRGSPTFGRHFGIQLGERDQRQLYLPPGLAHGFCVTSEVARFEYKCTDFYDPTSELSVRWDDPDLGIPWPIASPILSEKDRRAPRLCEIDVEKLPRFAG